MKHRLRALIVSAMLALTALLPTAAPVSADHTTNLAGRPIHTSTAGPWPDGWCTGIAYGRVNNALVLFTAAHCDNGTSPPDYGDVIYTASGQPLGQWFTTAVSRTWDLGWIRLYAGAAPPSPYLIYRGDCVNLCYGGSSSDYWTVNNLYGTSSWNCTNGPARVGATVNENWRTTQSSTTVYRTGTVVDFLNADTPCMFETSLLYSPTYRHSGAGLVDNNGEVIGIGTSINPANGRIRFSNFREAITAIDNDYVYGAHLCTYSLGNDCL